MNKKIMAFALSAMLCTAVCGCSQNSVPAQPTPPPIMEVVPSTLLSINEVCSITGTQLVQEGGVEKENGASYVLYRSEPWGAADTVKISVEQYSADTSKEIIKQKFDDDHAKRTAAVDVEGMENCFVAFPSVYYYKDGYYIKVTAGSGDTEKQKSLLISLIQTAAKNLDSFTVK